jgi:phage terminase large subunit GpA-like protein
MRHNPINVVICDRCGQYQEIPPDVYQRANQLQQWVRWGEKILCPKCAEQVEQQERQGAAHT